MKKGRWEVMEVNQTGAHRYKNIWCPETLVDM